MSNLNPYHGLGAKAESFLDGSAVFVSDVVKFLKEQNQRALRYSIIWALAERLSTDNLIESHYNVAGLNTDYIDKKRHNEVSIFYAFKHTDKATVFAELLSDSLSELYSDDNERAISLALETILYRSKRVKEKNKAVAPLSFNLLTLPDEQQEGYKEFGKQLHYYYALPTLFEKLNELGRAESKVETIIQFESAMYTLLTSLELLEDVLNVMKFQVSEMDFNTLSDCLDELRENEATYLNQILFEVFCSNPIECYTTDVSLIQLIMSYNKSGIDNGGMFRLSYVGINNFVESSLESNIVLNFDTSDEEEQKFQKQLAVFIKNQLTSAHKFSFSFPMLDSPNFNIKSALLVSEIKNMYTSSIYNQVTLNQIPTFFEFIIDFYRLRIALLTDPQYLANTLTRIYNINHPPHSMLGGKGMLSDFEIIFGSTESYKGIEPNRVRDSSQWRETKIREVCERVTDLNNLMDYKLDALSDGCMELDIPLSEEAIEATRTFMKRRLYYGIF